MTSQNETPQGKYGLLRSEEVAAYLNVSRSFVYRLLETGAIPAVRMGRAIRVLRSNLDEYIQTHISKMAQSIKVDNNFQSEQP
jgi:excisionase family DNA binding protein